MQALLLVAEYDRPTMFARIGVMRALQRHEPKAASGTAPEAGQGLQEGLQEGLQDCAMKPIHT
ncbi:MAG TPA: hypothetical protein VN831_25210 [Bradyrhizobium sp.]|nr:hypothetical protein [Bradyrhizobium sp.]